MGAVAGVITAVVAVDGCRPRRGSEHSLERGDGHRHQLEATPQTTLVERPAVSPAKRSTLSEESVAPPDLVVESSSVNDSGSGPNRPLRLRITAANKGGTRAQATVSRFFISSNPTISRSDTEVESTWLGGLKVLGRGDRSVLVSAPDVAGTYYYGACLDPVAGEVNAANNCSEGTRVSVGFDVDLVVESPLVEDSSVEPDRDFYLRTTVANRGVEKTEATTLRIYRSVDSEISPSDREVERYSVSALGVGRRADKSGFLSVPSTAGVYYFGACVDPVSGEANTRNNCSESIRLLVGVGADLVVESPLVDDRRLEANRPFQLRTTVANQGVTIAEATILRVYRSVDAEISRSDRELERFSVNSLRVSGRADKSVILHLPAASGTYYYGACVDAVSGEANTMNNCSKAVRVVVGGQ